MQTMRIWRRQSVSILDAVMRDQIQYFWLCLLCSLLNIVSLVERGRSGYHLLR